jgi:hypothetical protein
MTDVINDNKTELEQIIQKLSEMESQPWTELIIF